MNQRLLTVFIVILNLSCSKTVPTTNPASSPTYSMVGSAISLSHPVPLDTLLDWVRIGRVANGLSDIWFNNNNVGIITDGANLFLSHDGGNNWAVIPGTTFNNLSNFQFVDNQNGFVQGNSVLGITNDGGNTWVSKVLPSRSALYFQFIDATSGYYCDLTTGILKTTDAGNNWTALSIPSQKNFPFYFLDSLTGYSMNGGDFNKSTNGGITWKLISSKAANYGPGYYKMQFIDTLTGFAATSQGLLKTTDGGKTWSNCLNASTSLMIPYIFDSNNGYCIDRNIIYKTINGGKSWSISCQLTNDNFSGFHFLSFNTGWASTFGGYVLRLK